MRNGMKYIFAALLMMFSAALYAENDAQLWNNANDAYYCSVFHLFRPPVK